MEKIVLFTANVQGGILQLTLQLYKSLLELGYSPKIFMPYEIKDCDLGKINSEDIFQYHKEKRVLNKKPYRDVAGRISALSPQYIWYMDDSVICSNVGTYLPKNIKQLLTLHDAGTHHPTNHKSLRSVLVEKYTEMVNKNFYDIVYRFILLSPESEKTFSALYPKYTDKSVMMPLGAHLPDVEEVKPSEMTKHGEYLLFFGRIDKYKGIENLLKAYKKVSDKALQLVIAGGGQFTEKEKELIENCNNLTVINRYISDCEMKWLLHHMDAAVLPYIEATQSGIIPLAYLFGKPVIVSNVPGLTQFVENGETGIIYTSQEELEEAIVKMSQRQSEDRTSVICDYYYRNMDWNTNLKELFAKI